MKFEYYRDQKSKGMEMAGGLGSLPGATPGARATFRYRECMKNHAAAVGAHAVDGCGEFMAGGADGTIEAFKCAACNCHRNFHRKVMTDVGGGEGFIPLDEQAQCHPRRPTTTVYRPAAMGLESTSISGGLSREEQQEDVSNPAPKKRVRTKFTQEQKEKMTQFAEKLGWKIQKHDEADIEQFCKDASVKRHVLKVWIHNNKNKLGKKQ